ncbi:MAG: Ig-like domain-containing protein [Eubacteriales bacterium]|nr:Ig-like domain-containing protein [Eubacteriales bacterium]
MKPRIRSFCFAIIILCLVCSSAQTALASQLSSVLRNKYESLLGNPNISNEMIWDDGNTHTYKNWTVKQKDQLFDAIARIENDQAFPLDNPPQLTEDKYISAQDAWTIYITHVAHSLWVEANHIVNWSILDYSSDELRELFDSRGMFSFQSGKGYYFDYYAMGNATDWNIDISYQFMKENNYIKADPLSTFYAFAGWVSNNVAHSFVMKASETSQVTHTRFWKYTGPAPIDRVLYPVVNINKLGYSCVEGCWCTTALFSAVLRSVNIPTQNQFYNPQMPGSRVENHSTVVFPTLGIGLIHSDDIYGASDRLLGAGWWGNRIKYEDDMVPLERTFHSINWLEDNIFNPIAIDHTDTQQNTVAEQVCYNAQKSNADLNVDYLSEYFLWYRAHDSSEETPATTLIEQVQGSSVGNMVYYFAKPFYSDEEIKAIVQKFDNELIRIGNGDWKKGSSMVKNSGIPIIIDLASDKQSYQLYPDFSADALRQKIAWQSSKETVATISADGIITGLKSGITAISATAESGFRRKAVRKVIVTYYAKNIEISGNASVASGRKVPLVATVLPNETVNKKVTWTSSNPDIATISSSGIVAASENVDGQTAIITATAQDGSGVVATHEIIVTPAVENIVISQGDVDCTSKTLVIDLSTGISTLQLSSTLTPVGAYQKVTCISSNKSVATISESGLVSGLKTGVTTITIQAADGSKVKASCKIKVIK